MTGMAAPPVPRPDRLFQTANHFHRIRQDNNGCGGTVFPD